jgi:hypothetical protein
MALRRTSLALTATVIGLTEASAIDSALAQVRDPRPDGLYELWFRAPQPNQSRPGAASRPSNRDMRMAPSMGGRNGMMRGGGRVNRGMGRR